MNIKKLLFITLIGLSAMFYNKRMHAQDLNALNRNDQIAAVRDRLRQTKLEAENQSTEEKEFLEAVRNDNYGSVSQILENTTDTNIVHAIDRTFYHRIALSIALSRNNLGMAELLISRDPDMSGDFFHVDALAIAIEKNFIGIVKLLLDRKELKRDALNRNGDTPMDIAINKRNVAVVELLLKTGANVNNINIWGNTPLIKAAICKCTDIAQLLIDNRADIDYRPISTLARPKHPNALMHAVMNNDKSMVQLLLDNNADVDLKAESSDHGFKMLTAYDLAYEIFLHPETDRPHSKEDAEEVFQILGCYKNIYLPYTKRVPDVKYKFSDFYKDKDLIAKATEELIACARVDDLREHSCVIS